MDNILLSFVMHRPSSLYNWCNDCVHKNLQSNLFKGFSLFMNSLIFYKIIYFSKDISYVFEVMNLVIDY